MPIRRYRTGWEVRIQHQGKRVSRSFAVFRDAQEFERRYRSRVQDHRVGRTPRHTLSEAFGRWIDEELPRLKSQKWFKSLLTILLPFVKGRSLEEVPEVAEAIIAAGMKSGLAPAPINRRLALLKRVAKLSYRRWKWLDNDLGARIELLPGERKRSQWVTPAEAKRLLTAAKGTIREAIRWALLTGLRRGEILSIVPSSFKGRAVYLPDSKSGKPRSVPLPPGLDPRKFPFGIHPTALSKGFQAARTLAGLPDIRFHDLRRSYATWLLQGGAGLKEVQDLLGHANISMTSRYLGSSVEHLREAVATLPRLGVARG